MQFCTYHKTIITFNDPCKTTTYNIITDIKCVILNTPLASCCNIFPVRHTNMPQVYCQWRLLHFTATCNSACILDHAWQYTIHYVCTASLKLAVKTCQYNRKDMTVKNNIFTSQLLACNSILGYCQDTRQVLSHFDHGWSAVTCMLCHWSTYQTLTQ